MDKITRTQKAFSIAKQGNLSAQQRRNIRILLNLEGYRVKGDKRQGYTLTKNGQLIAVKRSLGAIVGCAVFDQQHGGLPAGDRRLVDGTLPA